MRRFESIAVIAAGAGLLVGCATVTIRKVPTPTQFVRWTDAQQRKADKMEGLRYYLPRPFLTVFESFPIRTDIYLANGMVSPDGKYVVVTSVTAESGLSRYVANDPRQVQIPTGFIYDPSKRDRDIKTQSANVSDTLEALTAATAGSQSVPTGVVGVSPGTPAPARAPAPPQPKTGLNTRKMTNDNGAFAYQPLRGNFDIVYLPDFEEQYVVSSKAGLGNAMFAINLGQGWSLQGFDSLVDNSELNKRIFDLIDTSMKLAKTAASGALGFRMPGDGTPAEAGIRPQSASESLTGKELPGTPVTLKIVVVHYAAKGLYPVIKPHELQERALEQTNTYGFLDLFELFPKPTMASSFDPSAIARAQAAIDNETGSYTVPRYPYQYISYNTFRYMAIEVIRPTNDQNLPFKNLYDKTGTQGETGQARTGEIDELLKRIIKIVREPKPDNGKPPPDEKTELTELVKGLPTSRFTIGSLDVEITAAEDKGNGVIEVALNLTGDHGSTTIESLSTSLLAKVKEIGVNQRYIKESQKSAIKTVTIRNRAEIENRLGVSDEDRTKLTAAATDLTTRKPTVTAAPAALKIESAVLSDGGVITVTLSVPTPLVSPASVSRATVEREVKAVVEAAVRDAGGLEGALRNIAINNWDAIKDKLGH